MFLKVIFLSFWVPVFCASGVEGSSSLLFLHFALFVIFFGYLFKEKIIPFIKNWEIELAQQLSSNMNRFQEAVNEKRQIQEKLDNIQNEINDLIKKAHETGKARKEAILANVRKRLQEKEEYKKRSLEELDRYKRDKIVNLAKNFFRAMASRELSQIELDNQIRYLKSRAGL